MCVVETEGVGVGDISSEKGVVLLWGGTGDGEFDGGFGGGEGVEIVGCRCGASLAMMYAGDAATRGALVRGSCGVELQRDGGMAGLTGEILVERHCVEILGFLGSL